MKKLRQKLHKLNIVALIPARGGSKGIKSKNLYLLGNKPLVAWSIESALKEKLIKKTYVSTDSKNITFYSKLFGAEIHKRPKYLAKDNSTLMDTVKSFLKFLNTEKKFKVDILIILEPTSPFRDKMLISNCLKKMILNKYDSIATFVKINAHPKRMWNLEKKQPTPLMKGDNFGPRQKLSKVYELDGRIYAFYANKKKLGDNILFGKAGHYICNKDRHVEIDDIDDINQANQLLKKL